MIPADLLNKLREADPDLWARATVPVADEISHCTRCDAWLHHCLQEAIRARGWWYSLMTIDGVMVTIARSGYPRDGDIIANGKTEAEALLRAYLAAIEEAKRE